MNAITVALGRELERAVRRLGDEARVIVIRGAGGNFCVGGDFHELERLRNAGEGALAELFDSFRAACAAVREVPVPVIGAVQGNAMAGGFELLQACDIAIVADDARLADNHANFGQVPGGGGSQRLPRIVGRQRALAHMLTGDRLTGSEAAAWGLAYRAVPADALETTVDEIRKAGGQAHASGMHTALVIAGLGLAAASALAFALPPGGRAAALQPALAGD